MADSMESLIEPSEYGAFDIIIQYGLLLGAIFQIVCIMAVIALPTREGDDWNDALTGTKNRSPMVRDGVDEKKTIKSATNKQTPETKTRKSDNKKRR